MTILSLLGWWNAALEVSVMSTIDRAVLLIDYAN